MTGFRSAASILGALCISSAALAAPPTAQALPDWPCREPDAGALSLASVYPGPLPATLPASSGAPSDPRVRAAAAFAAAPENTPEMGRARLDALARAIGDAERPRTLLLALEDIVARINELRDFIRDGITDKVMQSRLLAEEVAREDAEIAALPADAQARRAALETARRRNAAALGDRGEDAALLCHRLDYTARKARLLAAAIAARIEAAN